MKLASATDVLLRVSVNPTLGGAVSSAEAALEAATVLLSSLLETDMGTAVVRDYYSPEYAKAGKGIQVYLSRMFLDKEEGLTVSYGTYSGDVEADIYTAVSGIDYSIDYESGILKVYNNPTYGRMSLLVSYTSGFTGETDTRIPDWLKEAAISSATYVMHTQVAAHGKQDILDISPEYRRMVYSMIQQHIRPRLSCLFADQTVLED